MKGKIERQNKSVFDKIKLKRGIQLRSRNLILNLFCNYIKINKSFTEYKLHVHYTLYEIIKTITVQKGTRILGYTK